jgi:hypothetical protein
MSKMNRFISSYIATLATSATCAHPFKGRSPQNLNLSQRVKFKRLPHELSKKQEERMQRHFRRKAEAEEELQ